MAGLTSEQFQVIRQLLDAHPEGQTIPDIVAVLGDKPDARTLRGLLQQLDGVAVRIDTSQHTVRYFALATANANFRSQISDFKSAAPASVAVATSAAPSPGARPPPAASAGSDASYAADESEQSGAPAPHPALNSQPSTLNPGAVAPDVLLPIAVADFVRAGIVPQAARLLAENGARQNGLTGAAVNAFVERVLSVLANLTETEAAATYGVSADEYRIWAEHCGYAAGAAAPATSPFTVHGSPLAATQAPRPARSEAPASARPHPGTAGRPDRQNVSSEVAKHAPQTTPPPTPARAQPRPGSGGRPDRHLSPKDAGNSADSTSDRFTDSATAASAARSPAALPSLNAQPSTLNSAASAAASTPEARLRALWAQLKNLRPSWFWSKRWSVSNHIITGRRLLIATLWAAPWMYLQQHNVAFAVHAGWAVVILLPLPWAIFRWLDHPTQGPLTLKTGFGLGVGTTVPFMLASPLSALGDWMLHGLPRTVAAVFSLYAASPQTKPAAELETRNAKVESASGAPIASTNPSSPAAPTPVPPGARPPSAARAASDASDVADGYESDAPVPDGRVAPPAAIVAAPSSLNSQPATLNSAASTAVSPPQSAIRTPQLPAPPPPRPSEIENRDSKIGNSPPAFPAASGAYALTSTGWSPLPRNGSTTIARMRHAPFPEDKQPAGSTEVVVAELIFSGSEPVPSIPPAGGMLVYIGPFAAIAAASPGARPVLRRPGEGGPPSAALPAPLELGALNVGTGIARLAPLTDSAAGPSLGPRRMPVTLEQVSATVTVLHVAARLAPGRYALHAADQYFEVAVDSNAER